MQLSSGVSQQQIVSELKGTVLRILRGSLGRPCWQVRWDRQIGLDMNFGAPRMELRQPTVSTARSPRVRAQFARRGVYLRGSHWLVAHPGRWRLALADGLTVRDTASAKRLDIATARLEGELLEGLAIDRQSGRTEFFFDLGARLTVQAPRAYSSDPDLELWSLHSRSRFVAVFAGGSYDTGPLSTNGGDRQPLGDKGWIVVARSAKLERKLLRRLRVGAG